MKIVQISTFFPPSPGGSERYCFELSKRLVEKGYDVEVLTSNIGRLPQKETINDIKIKRLNTLNILNINPISNIIPNLKKLDFDVAHAHSYIFFNTLQVSIYRKYKPFPYILHLHGGLYNPEINDYKTKILYNIKNKIYDPILGRITLSSPDIVASVSKTDIELATKIMKKDKRNTVWVPNAIDDTKFTNTSNEKIIITYIGRLEPWKGINVFLYCINKLTLLYPDIKFYIIGDGSLREQVLRFISKYKNVIYFGQIPHSQVIKKLSNTSILVIPSQTEGIPTTGLEAMASRIPIVATNVGGIPEIVKDGFNGFLFSPGNYEECIFKINELILNSTLRIKMGDRGNKILKKKFTWPIVLKKIIKLYDKMN